MPPDALLPVSARPGFVALPADPSIPLMPQQEAALWGGNVERALLGILRGTLASQSHLTAASAAALVKAGVNDH